MHARPLPAGEAAENGAGYVRIMKKAIEKGTTWLDTEEKRLHGVIAKGKMSAAKVRTQLGLGAELDTPGEEGNRANPDGGGANPSPPVLSPRSWQRLARNSASCRRSRRRAWTRRDERRRDAAAFARRRRPEEVPRAVCDSFRSSRHCPGVARTK